jgi:hypothetical protein
MILKMGGVRYSFRGRGRANGELLGPRVPDVGWRHHVWLTGSTLNAEPSSRRRIYFGDGPLEYGEVR